MPASHEVLTAGELPRPLRYCIGATCGVLAAMVIQILLSRRGIELEALLHDLHTSQALQLQSAGAWWLIAGSALVVGAAVVAAVGRLTWLLLRFPLIGWALGIVLVFALADVGDAAATPAAGSIGVHVALSLTALVVATLLATAGAILAARR